MIDCATVVGEIHTDQRTLVLVPWGEPHQVSNAHALIGDVTANCKDSTETIGLAGGITTGLAWPTVVQLANILGPSWTAGPRLVEWVHEQTRRRTLQAQQLWVPTPPGLTAREYQVQGAAMIREVGSVLFWDDPGPQPVDTPILTPTGWTTLGALQAGDVVFNLHGEPTPVRRLVHHGRQPVYRVTLNDRTSTLATGNHRWRVYTDNDRKRGTPGRVLSTDQLSAAGLHRSDGGTHFFLPQQPVLHLGGQTFPGLSPYAYGALLGDGSLGGDHLSISCPDDSVIDRVVRSTRRLGTSGKRNRPDDGRCQNYVFHRNGKLRAELADLGALVRSEAKHVDPRYLYAHVGARRALLAGLLDTDGTVTKDGAAVEFSSASPQLAADVAWLGRSLGAVCTESAPQPAGYCDAGGNRIECQDKHRVLLRFPAHGPNPFDTPRKAEAWTAAAARVQRRHPPRSIQIIESAGAAEVCCIELDTDDEHARVYLTDTALIPTHNTGKTITTILGLIERAAQGFPVLPVVVVCPASVVDPWVEEARKWAPFWRTISWHGSPARRRKLMGTADIYVASYGTAVRDAPSKETDGKRNKSRPLMELGPNAVVGDEMHMMKTSSSSRSLAVRRLAKDAHTRGGLFIGLSGTPITHGPGDAFPSLEALDPNAYPNKDRWIARYCHFEKRDYSLHALGLAGHREEEFRHVLLGQSRRVNKADVASELPPKVHVQRYVDIPAPWRAAYDQMADIMRADLPDSDEPLEVMSVLAQLTRLSQLASAAADVETTMEWVYDEVLGRHVEKEHVNVTLKRPSWKCAELLEIMAERPGRPIVAFAGNPGCRQLVEIAADMAREQGYRVGMIIGGQSKGERTRNRLAFQAGELDLICVTTDAGGVGITLTRSDCAVFLARPFSLVQALQAEDRLHRIGASGKSVEIIDIIARDAIDVRVREVLKSRAGELSDFVADPRIVRELFGGTKATEHLKEAA